MTERFELLEQAGRGAMGVVWRARDNERGKIVAIKMLRDLHADDPEYVERFAHEVDLASSVRSPHVVRVRGYGARGGVPFLVLEFVAGRSLRARIAEDGPFPPAEARDLLAQITEALAAVHAVGIVHRDVKASNVLLTEEGVAKLTDFGIARDSDTKGLTRKGSLVGTPAYMAPEGPVDARSDLYSLGVLYYELLTGVLPFSSTNFQEVLLAHVSTPPDLTRIPADERKLTGWLMAKDPAARPQSARALLATLKASGPGSAVAATATASTAGKPRAGTPDADPAKTRAGAWTPTPTPTATRAPSPVRTPTRTPMRNPTSTSYGSLGTRSPRQSRRQTDRQAAGALVAVAVIALVMLAAVVLLASGTSGTSAATASVATAVASAAPTPTSQNGPLGSSLVPIAALFLAVGALAVVATVARSRARGKAR